MRSQRKPRKSLAEVSTYSEAIQVLSGRGAPSIFKKTVDMIFKVDTSQPAGRTYVKQMLQETENDLKKMEEQKLLGHQMNEMEPGEDDEFQETEGNPSSGGNPKENDSGDKSGVVAQSDGDNLESQIDKTESSGDGSRPAQSQPGISQLKEAINQVADQGSVDPMNKAVIDYMSNGMSQVEATNAASADNNMMEAVFKKNMAQILPKVLSPFVNEIARLQETIRAYDSKIESMRKQSGTKGFQESIQIIPTGPAPQSKGTSRFEGQTVEEISKDIASKYIDLS